MNRRNLLYAVSIGVLSGCLSSIRRSEPSTSQHDSNGAAAPWARQESPVDVLVENFSTSTMAATVSVDGHKESITLGVSEEWVSDNILESGEDATIAVTTGNGLHATLSWMPENNGVNRIAQFKIRDNRIETSLWEQDE